MKRYEVWTALRANDGVDPGERQGPGAYDARVEALERNGDDSISMRIFLYILSGFDELLFEETRVGPLGGSGFLVGIERILRDDER